MSAPSVGSSALQGTEMIGAEEYPPEGFYEAPFFGIIDGLPENNDIERRLLE